MFNRTKSLVHSRLSQILNQTNPLHAIHCRDNSNNDQYSNEAVTLASYPSGNPEPKHFAIERELIHPQQIQNDDILIQMKCISIDAYMRTTMTPPTEGKLHSGTKIGDKLHALALGQIIVSKNKNYKVGDYVSGGFAVEKYALMTQQQLRQNPVQIVVPPTDNPDDLRYYLTYLGITTGCSAYAGVYYATKEIKKNDIVVVTAASGAVGSIACQLYRNLGAKVIGITGGEDKKRYLLDTLRLYECIDYKTENIQQQLAKYAPNGFDVAFDNVGGKQLDDLLQNVSENGQIVICGAVSQYNNLAKDGVYGPKNYLKLAERNAVMTGFNMFAHIHKLKEIRQDLLKMVKSGELVIREVPIYGLDNFSLAMSKLLNGDKNGRLLLFP